MMTSRRSAFDQAVVADAGGAGIGIADDVGLSPARKNLEKTAPESGRAFLT
jgi:hypothetical protein